MKGTWQAVVRVGKGQRTVLGVFPTAEAAARAHDSAAYHLHGRWVQAAGRGDYFQWCCKAKAINGHPLIES